VALIQLQVWWISPRLGPDLTKASHRFVGFGNQQRSLAEPAALL